MPSRVLQSGSERWPPGGLSLAAGLGFFHVPVRHMPRAFPFEYRAAHNVEQIAGCVGATIACGRNECAELMLSMLCSCHRRAASCKRFASASAPIIRFRVHPGAGDEDVLGRWQGGLGKRFQERIAREDPLFFFQVLWLALPGLRAIPDQAGDFGRVPKCAVSGSVSLGPFWLWERSPGTASWPPSPRQHSGAMAWRSSKQAQKVPNTPMPGKPCNSGQPTEILQIFTTRQQLCVVLYLLVTSMY